MPIGRFTEVSTSTLKLRNDVCASSGLLKCCDIYEHNCVQQDNSFCGALFTGTV